MRSLRWPMYGCKIVCNKIYNFPVEVPVSQYEINVKQLYSEVLRHLLFVRDFIKVQAENLEKDPTVC